MGEHEIEDVDESVETEGDNASADVPTDEQRVRVKAPANLERMALRELRQARRLVTANEGEPTADATLRVSAANVLAILELAAAIRSTRPESGES